MPAMHEVSAFCDSERMLVLFGHHLLTPEHVTKMLATDSTAAAITLFRTNSESHCKITELDSGSRCVYAERHDSLVPLNDRQFYVDLPYVLPSNFFDDNEYSTLKRWFVKGDLPRTALAANERVYGVIADFPHEFHKLSDLPSVGAFAKQLLPKLGSARPWIG